MTKVAINGFGRIGRLAFRQMFEAEGYEVVAINDLTSPKMLAHLLKYDTAQGGFCGKFGEGKHTVDCTDNSIIVDGKEITIYAVPNAAELPWGKLGVDVVLECTGFYTSKEKASAHLTAGAKKVVISAPAGNDLPTIVYNVNHKTLTPADTVISAASCTTNIGLVIPELNGKLIGAAQRVPTPTGSTTILHAVVKGEVTVEDINAAMKAATNESFGYTEEKLVSSDIIGMKFGSLFDANQTMVSKIGDGNSLVQVVAWYDNENSYTSQMVRTIKYLAELK